MRMSLHHGFADGSYRAAVVRTYFRTIRATGSILYRRVLGSWERRVSRTESMDNFVPCQRLPRAVRELHEASRAGTLEVEFDTKTRTAKLRPVNTLLEV